MAEVFFGFKPSGFVDDVFNTVDDYIAQAVDSLEQAAESELNIKSSSRKGAAAARSELKEGCDGLVEQLQHIFHKNIDLFEMYVLKNIFVLPQSLEDAGGEPTVEETAGAETTNESLDTEIAELVQAVAAARVRHRTLQRVQRMYAKRLPALQSDAARLTAISDSMVHTTAAETASASGAASSAGPSGTPSLSELTTQAAEAVALCSRLTAAADGSAAATSVNGEKQARGKARQSFGGVMSQFERDVKKLGGGKRPS